MRLPHLPHTVWRTGLPMGAAAAVLVWAVFLALGGVHGAEREGTVLPIAVFLLEALAFAYAGFRVRRLGLGAAHSAMAGALAGLTAELGAGFWRTSILFLNRGYMHWIQFTTDKTDPALSHMPWPPFSIAAALIGTVLAGIVVGAASGAIGGSLAERPDGAARP